jgi:hypothetical protein
LAGLVGAALGLIQPGPVHPILRGVAVSGGSGTAVIGRGEAVVSASPTGSVAFEYAKPVTGAVHRHVSHPRAGHRIRQSARIGSGLSRRAAVRPSAPTTPWVALVLAVAAALALAAGLRRRFGA